MTRWDHPHGLERRARTGRGVVLIAFGVLLLAFFRVQVVNSERYAVESQDNRLREISLPAPRGLIVDRNGAVLAENVPGYSVGIVATSEDSVIAFLNRLAPLLSLTRSARERILARYRDRPSEPVMVIRDAPFELVSALEERRPWNPGLVIRSDPKRRYPFGSAAAHVVGYVGEVTEEELRAGVYEQGGMLVGRAGLEEVYDEQLRGQRGVKFVEVDALGRMVRETGVVEPLAPEQGTTLRTTLDGELQRYVAQRFPAGWRGAVVALDARTGGVLALYSAPSYDPNTFVGVVDPDAWRQLSESPEFPLFNRVTQARYAPASPFKLAVAAMALERGIADMDTRMAIPCRGGLQYGNRYFRCWRTEGHGNVTLGEAIQYSCDVYFYQLALKLQLDNLLHDAVSLGFRERVGIDLPNEERSVFPPSREYYNQRYGPRGWTPAVTLNLAIGQGENTQTPINMVAFFAMLAHPEGRFVTPHLVEPANGHDRRLRLSPADLAGLRDALVAVVDRGTAAGARIAELRIAGKTGTAQNPHGEDHGWYIAFAPADDPQIVVGAIVEHIEHGSSVAPLVNDVIARHLLGPGWRDDAPGRVDLDMPADSAPEPVPILPDPSQPPSDSIPVASPPVR
ncbi:MAG: penicillin-binding protein 2 [Gemmatimonadales bacterium]|jgi:penicillin-binding protein 2